MDGDLAGTRCAAGPCSTAAVVHWELVQAATKNQKEVSGGCDLCVGECGVLLRAPIADRRRRCCLPGSTTHATQPPPPYHRPHNPQRALLASVDAVLGEQTAMLRALREIDAALAATKVRFSMQHRGRGAVCRACRPQAACSRAQQWARCARLKGQTRKLHLILNQP